MFNNFKIIKKGSARDNRIKNFVIRNHYSKSLSRGNKYVFLFLINKQIRGVATFGTPVGKDSPGDLECKRFCLAPNAPKNTASWFMAKCLKQIKQDGKYASIISYADPEQGHEGTIYRASNFHYLGTQKKKGQAIKLKGKIVHLRVAYQKINGQYTKTALNVQKCLKNKTAKWIYLAPKHIFKYNFN